MQGSKLYGAKEAAWICSIDEADLQVALDRGYVRATIVPQGARTYRRFSRDQIVSLWVFRRMVQDGIKPSMAKAYLLKMEMTLASASELLRPIRYFVFRSGTCRFIPAGEPLSITDGWILDYAELVHHVDARELQRVAAIEEESVS